MALQRENQLRTGLLGPCHDQQAAGVLVNSMDKTCSGQSSLFGVMVNDGIGQRTIGIACTRVDHKARRFIDDEDVMVLMDNLKRQFLRPPRPRLDWRHFQADLFATSNRIPPFWYPAENRNPALFGPLLKL